MVDKVSRCLDGPFVAGAFEKDQREPLLDPRQQGTNVSEGRGQTLVGLPLRNDERRVVVIFGRRKRSRRELMVLHREMREEPCPGLRELEESAKKRVLDRDWRGKEGETMNAGGVGELE
ncbi:hypothetical protein TNCV_5135521 [Trichonephila clavipes]|nr:hypothetical protein TNCV_5135521 [Trichonephila clavipes]